MRLIAKLFTEQEVRDRARKEGDLWSSGKRIPRAFMQTLYGIPSSSERAEIEACNLTSSEILQGLSYTTVGRGMRSAETDGQILETLKLLQKEYPNNEQYLLAEEEFKKKPRLNIRG